MMFVLGICLLLAKDAILLAISNETEIRRPEILSNIIFTQPYTTVKHLTVKNVYAENTARAYLNKLTEMSILEKRTIQGHHYYLNLELSNILSK
jgi:Fic family protein